MRVTTNMIRRNYKNNLNSTLSGLNAARNQAETGRKFVKSYEDPTSAAKGSVLENRYARNTDYTNAAKNTQKWQDTQEDVLTELSSIAKEIDKNYALSAVSDTSATQRSTYAATFREQQKSMVYALNTQYGNVFVMAGTNGDKPPFELSEDGKTLTYQGINVEGTGTDAATGTADIDTLKNLASEHSYIDLGFGLTFDDAGEVVPSSAFDAAFPGIKAVGYGQTEDGTSKNLISLMGQMADILDADTFDRDAYETLWMQFSSGTSNLTDCITEIGTKTQLLDATTSRLENEKINITTQYDSAVNIEETEALTNFSYAQYVYTAALKIGSSILSNSLLDYIR